MGLDRNGFHKFRHTLATGMFKRGVPPQAVSPIIGHSSPCFVLRRAVWDTSRVVCGPRARNITPERRIMRSHVG